MNNERRWTKSGNPNYSAWHHTWSPKEISQTWYSSELYATWQTCENMCRLPMTVSYSTADQFIIGRQLGDPASLGSRKVAELQRLQCEGCCWGWWHRSALEGLRRTSRKEMVVKCWGSEWKWWVLDENISGCILTPQVSATGYGHNKSCEPQNRKATSVVSR